MCPAKRSATAAIGAIPGAHAMWAGVVSGTRPVAGRGAGALPARAEWADRAFAATTVLLPSRETKRETKERAVLAFTASDRDPIASEESCAKSRPARQG